MDRKKRVVVVGAGFGGLTLAKELGGKDCDVTVVDRTNYHLFQPLLYQVAIAGLSPADIAYPIRSALAECPNVRVLLSEVIGIDRKARTIALADDPNQTSEETELPFDTLVIATGAGNNYFGHPEWEAFAPGLKSIEDALEIRKRVLLAFESAERSRDEAEQKMFLTFVVIGGGPTGVELAGAIAELARTALASDFRSIRPEFARVILMEGGERILSAFTTELSERGSEQLREMGVEIMLSKLVTNIDANGVSIGEERIDSRTVLWAAGVSASPLAKHLETQLDRGGRVLVESDCSIPGDENIYVIGDLAAFSENGKMLPGLSPVAMQQARYVAKLIHQEIPKEKRTAFRYTDKGIMATIGRSRAIAQQGNLQLSGFIAWIAWLGVHIWFLIGFRNRLVVFINWAWSYLMYRRGARLITGYARKST